MRWSKLAILSLAAFFTAVARGDIYQWEYIDPLHPELGKQQSSTLAPDGAGRESVPHANLSDLDLSMAWLHDHDLHDASFWRATLTNADLSHANLADANFDGANLADADFSIATLTDSNLRGASLAGTKLGGATLIRANLTAANLADADLGFSTLTDASVASASVRGASFYSTTSFTAEQLYTTTSYQTADLTGIHLGGNDLTGWNFAGQNLASARFSAAILVDSDLRGANLVDADFGIARLTHADFTGAEVHGASFMGSDLSAAQLSSTASYQAGDLSGIRLAGDDLTGWDFTGQNLSSAHLRLATLTDADFTGADVRGTDFGFTTGRGFTPDQLYSTASYQAGDLVGIVLEENDLSDWNFAGQNLTEAQFSGATLISADFSGADLSHATFASYFYGGANLRNADFDGAKAHLTMFVGVAAVADTPGANFSGADSRGALVSTEFESTVAGTHNFIHPDGHVDGLNITTGETVRLWDFDPTLSQYFLGFPTGEPIGDIPIVIEDAMSIDHSGTLRAVFEDDQWGSTITFEPGIPVSLDGTLALLFDNDVDPLSLVGTTYQLFDWTGISPEGQFDLILTQNGLIWNTHNLYSTGEVTLIGAVPEPSTLLLGGMALAVVGALSRRR